MREIVVTNEEVNSQKASSGLNIFLI